MNTYPVHQDSNPASTSSPVPLTEAWPIALVFVLGIVIVGMVGFAPGMAHEAAHDVRHTFVFPCH